MVCATPPYTLDSLTNIPVPTRKAARCGFTSNAHDQRGHVHVRELNSLQIPLLPSHHHHQRTPTAATVAATIAATTRHRVIMVHHRHRHRQLSWCGARRSCKVVPLVQDEPTSPSDPKCADHAKFATMDSVHTLQQNASMADQHWVEVQHVLRSINAAEYWTRHTRQLLQWGSSPSSRECPFGHAVLALPLPQPLMYKGGRCSSHVCPRFEAEGGSELQ